MTREEAHTKAYRLAREDHSHPLGWGVAYYYKIGKYFDAGLSVPDGAEWCATIHCTHDRSFGIEG